MEAGIRNRVAEAGIIPLDLMTYRPAGEIAEFDLTDFLYMGLMLREKDFRFAMETVAWSRYAGQAVSVICSSEAIVPQWAYMLVAVKLEGVAVSVYFGSKEAHLNQLWLEQLRNADFSALKGKKVVVKNDIRVPGALYMEIAGRLKSLVAGLMYGEPGMPKVVYKQESRK